MKALNPRKALTCIEEALFEAYEALRRLGDGAIEAHLKKEYMGKPVPGGNSIKGDIACEAAMIKYFSKSGIDADVVSEEHGVQKIGYGSAPRYTIYMDGIDGTTAFKNGKKSGTMVAIFDGRFPRFKDALASGVLFYPNGYRSESFSIIYAAAGMGAHKQDIDVSGIDSCERIRTSKQMFIDYARITYDSHWPVNQAIYPRLFPEFTLGCQDASCVDILNVAMGFTELHGECTRGPGKPTLEIPISHLIVKEAGGLIIGYDCNSKNFGELVDNTQLRFSSNGKIVEYGSQIQYPVLISASWELAAETTKRYLEIKK